MASYLASKQGVNSFYIVSCIILSAETMQGLKACQAEHQQPRGDEVSVYCYSNLIVYACVLMLWCITTVAPLGLHDLLSVA